MIIVTGANGKLGTLVVEQLLARVDARKIAVSVREPRDAQAFADRGVRVRRGDFADRASLDDAFAGATRVLVISASATGDTAKRWNRTAIEVAAGAGAGHVLYTSHVGVADESPFPPMPVHAASEAVGRACGAPFTSLRNGFYASTVPRLLAGARESGELRAPADGPVSWTAHADLAEATAMLLTDPDLEAGEIALTAAEALTLDEVAEIAGVERVTVSDEEYREGLLAEGVPEFGADMTLGIHRASREGAFARVDPALERLLGRPPTSLGDYLSGTGL